MLSIIRGKIRALVTDFPKTGFETFLYTTTPTFTIAQENITLTKVLLNGVEIDDYTFDTVTNKITVTVSALDTTDVIEVDYTYYKYSNSELNEYIRSALVWISVYSSDDEDYELELAEESGEHNIISPTPDNRTTDLIALISSILIKPDYSQYKLPNVTVVYPRNMSKELRIEKLIGKFNVGLGINDVIEFDIFPYDQFNMN